ncbi:hypothetical protein HMPREF0556_10389 [Listeria grayi DSM 20601]|uniref:Uncharacterized protein n=1 Tax=Listeria grayi DSM 20601 TaxID=525367 RepID=D7UVB4_LISGR|nr:hypothetical protein HMPREF0556_10389 [Listeria grayi DSM 20601]
MPLVIIYTATAAGLVIAQHQSDIALSLLIYASTVPTLNGCLKRFIFTQIGAFTVYFITLIGEQV